MDDWIVDAYALLSTKELYEYKKDDFAILTLTSINSMPIKEYTEACILYKNNVPRKLSDNDIPKNIYKQLYYIDIKASKKGDSTHKHRWDIETLNIFLDYLRDNLLDADQISLIPLTNYSAIDFDKKNAFALFREKAKIEYINLGAYKREISTTQILFDRYFKDMVYWDNENQYEFIFINNELLGVDEYFDRYY